MEVILNKRRKWFLFLPAFHPDRLSIVAQYAGLHTNTRHLQWVRRRLFRARENQGRLKDETYLVFLWVLRLSSHASHQPYPCLLYTSPSPRDGLLSRMPSSA